LVWGGGGAAIFSLTRMEVSLQPFANILRCIALGVMECLFILVILAKKMEGALEEIEGVRLYIVMLHAALIYNASGANHVDCPCNITSL
jgi:hypothetical protein